MISYFGNRSNLSIFSITPFSGYFIDFFPNLFPYDENQTGMTYITYVNRIRTKKALHLLMETDMTVEIIGFDCGFSSLPIFYKCFKEHYGVTPGELRVKS